VSDREHVLARLGGRASRALVGGGRHVWIAVDME
jgi:hypothetical protein